jgi:hypothetical protein
MQDLSPFIPKTCYDPTVAKLKLFRKMKKSQAPLFLLLLIAFQASNVYGDDYQWDFINALVKNDFNEIERIINKNADQMQAYEKRLAVGFTLTYTRGENTLRVLDYLSRRNVHPAGIDLYNALNLSHSDNVVQFILNEGVIPNGEILLLAAGKQRFNFAEKFIIMGADVNYRYPTENSSAEGMTALLYASQWGNLETVKLLVEHGADVNVRAANGSTAASIALENDQPAVYNFLKEHGAVEVEINQTVTGSASAPTGNSVPANNSAAVNTSGVQGIADILNNNAPELSNGTYRLSGGTTEIKFIGNAKAGNITYTKQGSMGYGFFQINGSTLTLIMEGYTFDYQITTNTSFSGNRETWVRVGN